MKSKTKKKKVRYIQQRNNFSCSPVAMINTLKWLGYPLTRKHIKVFEALMDTTRTGTPANRTKTTLNLFKVKYEEIVNLKPKDIDKALEEGKLVHFHFAWIEDGIGHSHEAIIDKKTPKRYRLINATENKIDYWDKKRLRKEFKWAGGFIIER